jgi:hypothetical protein
MLQVAAWSDANLYSLADDQIAVAAFDSCAANDGFAFMARFRRVRSPNRISIRRRRDIDDCGSLCGVTMWKAHRTAPKPPVESGTLIFNARADLDPGATKSRRWSTKSVVKAG